MAESPWEHLVCFQQEAEPFPLKLALRPGGLESASPGPPVLEEKPAQGMKSWWLRRCGLRRRQAAQTIFLLGLSESHPGLSFLPLYLSNAAIAAADNARGCRGTRKTHPGSLASEQSLQWARGEQAARTGTEGPAISLSAFHPHRSLEVGGGCRVLPARETRDQTHPPWGKKLSADRKQFSEFASKRFAPIADSDSCFIHWQTAWRVLRG